MEDGMQDNMAPAPEHHDGLKQAVVALVIIVVLLALGFWLYSAVNQVTVEDLGDGREKVSVQQGQVVANFPRELVQENNPDYLESYSINDATSEQPVVRYYSSMNMQENIAAFNTYFSSSEWVVVEQPEEGAVGPIVSFYAYRNTDQVSIVLSQQEEAVLVEIGFLNKQR